MRGLRGFRDLHSAEPCAYLLCSRILQRQPDGANAQGNNTKTRSTYISVSNPSEAPVANFTGEPTTGDSPLSVQFSDQSTGSITTYSWDFGDSGTSTLQNPAHTYTGAGTYSVNLTVTGPGGSNSKLRTNYISVGTPPVAPVANFTGTPTTGRLTIISPVQ